MLSFEDQNNEKMKIKLNKMFFLGGGGNRERDFEIWLQNLVFLGEATVQKNFKKNEKEKQIMGFSYN